MLSKAKIYKNQVVIYYSKAGKVLRYPTGIKVDSKHFDERKYILKSSGIKNYKDYNYTIESIRQKVDGLIMEYLQQGETPSVIQIKNKLKVQSTHSPTASLVDYFKDFLDFKKPYLRPDSLKNLNSLKNALSDYETYLGKQHTSDCIDSTWIKGFERFLQEDRSSSKKYITRGNLNNNTVKKRMKHFKQFWNYLVDNDLASRNKHLDNYHIAGYDTNVITLEDRHLQAVIDFKLDDSKEQYVRDFFVFGCMTGMRFSDITTLEVSDIKTIETDEDELKIIYKYAQKTKQPFQVALNDRALKIIEKYGYNFSLVKNQVFNRMIKDILSRIPEFQQEVKTRRIVGNTVEHETKRLWETIGSHTGRRTFVTRSIKKQTPLNEIMKMTGHRGHKMLLKYLQIYGNDESREVVAKLDLASKTESQEETKQLIEKAKEMMDGNWLEASKI